MTDQGSIKQSNELNDPPQLGTTTGLLEPMKKPGNYWKALLIAIAISVLYFGSAGLIILIATSEPNASGLAWLLIGYALFFPIYLYLTFGIFLKTFSDRAKTHSLIVISCLLLFLSIIYSTYNLHRQKVGETVFYQTMIAGVLGFLVIIPAIKIFRGHKVTSSFLILLSTSFIWLGVYGQHMYPIWAAQRYAAQKAEATKQTTKQNEEALNSQFAELENFSYTFYVPPLNSIATVDPISKSGILANTGSYSQLGGYEVFPDDEQNAQSPNIYLYMQPLDSSDQLSSSSTSCYSGLLEITLVNGLLSKYSPCNYSFTTQDGSKVFINSGQYTSYFFNKGKDYLYFEDKYNIFSEANQKLGTFIDSLVPATLNWFE